MNIPHTFRFIAELTAYNMSTIIMRLEKNNSKNQLAFVKFSAKTQENLDLKHDLSIPPRLLSALYCQTSDKSLSIIYNYFEKYRIFETSGRGRMTHSHHESEYRKYYIV